MNDALLESPVKKFAFVTLADAVWTRNPMRPFYESRELGLREATEGQVRANHIRIVSNPGGGTGWHCHDSDFQLVYVLAGRVRFRLRDGAEVTLAAHDCAQLPAFTLHDEVEFSPDFQVLEITMPAEVQTMGAVPDPQPPRARTRFMVNHLREDSFVRGRGPREFLEYRDLGLTEATGRRLEAQVVRTRGPCEHNTGWHYHTLDLQIVYALGGWVRTELEGHGMVTMRPGDALCVPSRLRHNVHEFSEDFEVLEINMPADYDTVPG